MIAYAETPALPLHTAGPYVAAAYIVFVDPAARVPRDHGLRTGRTQRDVLELRRELDARGSDDDPLPDQLREEERVA